MSRSYRAPVAKAGASSGRKRSYRRLLRHHLDGQVHEDAEAVALKHPLSMDDWDVCDFRRYMPESKELRRK